MRNENEALGTNLLAFLLGAAAGAVVVALAARKSGPDIQAQIKDLVCRLKSRAGEAKKALGSVVASPDKPKYRNRPPDRRVLHAAHHPPARPAPEAEWTLAMAPWHPSCPEGWPSGPRPES